MSAAESYAFPSLDGGPVETTAASAATRAAELVAGAEARAARILAEAAERGYQEGFQSGLAEARERFNPAAAALAAALDEIGRGAAEQVVLVERQAVELALALAQKIVAAALDVQPELVVSVVQGVLRGVTERERIVLEVNPEDLELVREAVDSVAAGLGGFGQLEVIAERRVPRGGCRVHMHEGEIDGTVETQLERAGDAVRSALQGEA